MSQRKVSETENWTGFDCLSLVIYLSLYHPLLILFLFSYYRTMFTPIAGPTNEVKHGPTSSMWTGDFLLFSSMWVMEKVNESLWLKHLMNVREHWFVFVDELICPSSLGISTEVCFFRSANASIDRSSRHSLLFRLSMYQTRSSPSLFDLWQMRSQIRSSLSLVKHFSRLLPVELLRLLRLLGRIVVFHSAIINSLFYFSAGHWFSVFTSQRLLWSILFISGRSVFFFFLVVVVHRSFSFLISLLVIYKRYDRWRSFARRPSFV